MAAVLVVALLYALGRYTPVYALAFEYVPGINLFRRPIDGTFVLVAAFALHCRPAAGRLRARGRPARCALARGCRRPWRSGVVGWAVVFSEQIAPRLGVAVGGCEGGSRWRSSSSRCWRGRARPRRRALAAACVAAMAAAELIWFNAASSLNAEAPAYYSVLQQPAGADAQALAVLEREIADRHRQGERPRIEVVGVSGSWQNLAMARGLEATNGYNPLRIGSYDRLVSPGETTHIVDQRLFPASFDGYDCALARELGLEYVVLGRPIDEVPHLARRPVSDVLLAGPKMWIYRLRRKAESRVKFVKRVSVADADAQVEGRAVSLQSRGRARPRRRRCRAVATRSADQRRDARRAARASFPGAWTAWKSRSTTSSPDILVVHEAYYPGLGRGGRRAACAHPAHQRALPRRGGGRGTPPRRLPLRALLAVQFARCAHDRARQVALKKSEGRGAGRGLQSVLRQAQHGVGGLGRQRQLRLQLAVNTLARRDQSSLPPCRRKAAKRMPR